MMYRQLQPKDLDQVVRLAYETFMRGYYDIPEGDLMAGTHDYVVMAIRDSTFAEVCVEDGKVIGFIMGYVAAMDGAFSESDYPLLSCNVGSFREICTAVSECNSRLKSSFPEKVDCESALLAVDPDARGKGIGTRLFDDIIAHFRENGCRTMFLFTGDNCDMRYYEHRSEYVLAGREMLDIGSRVRDCRMYVRRIRILVFLAKDEISHR